MHGSDGLAHHFVQAVELLAEGAFQLVHESNQNILKQVLHLAGLIAARSLYRPSNRLQWRLQAVFNGTADLIR